MEGIKDHHNRSYDNWASLSAMACCPIVTLALAFCVPFATTLPVDEETGSFDGSDTLSDALGYTLWVIVLCLCCAFCCCLWHP